MKVLFLAYHFPPLGGAGVQRSACFARYLPDSGFEPVVVTGPLPRDGARTPRDDSLARDLGCRVTVYRLADGPLASGTTRRRPLRRWFGGSMPFSQHWLEGCVNVGQRAAADQRPKLIYATMSPFETAEAAARLSGLLQLPWVADLRDPWALDEVMLYPTRWHRAAELRRMRKLLKTAARIVMNTPEATRALRDAIPEYPAEHVVTIPNGYDARDFPASDPPNIDDRFRIVHTGQLHTALGLRHRQHGRLRRWLGGHLTSLDLLTRSHVFLLQALSRWAAAEPQVREQVRLSLVGRLSAADAKAIDESGVSEMVERLGYCEHRESVAWLRRAQLLLLPMHDLPTGTRARIVPAKTYEYLAAGRPILAAVPDGDARDLVARSGRGHLCRPADVEGMIEVLTREFARFQSGEPAPSGDPDVLATYERQELTLALAQVFSEALRECSACQEDTESPLATD